MLPRGQSPEEVKLPESAPVCEKNQEVRCVRRAVAIEVGGGRPPRAEERGEIGPVHGPVAVQVPCGLPRTGLAEVGRACGAEVVPLDVAAEAVDRADKRTAGRVRAGGRAVVCAAVACERAAAEFGAALAHLDRFIRAGLVPRAFAAERVDGTDGDAAFAVRAGGRGACGAAVARFGKSAARRAQRAAFRRDVRAGLVPRLDAAERVEHAHGKAAVGVGAARGTRRLAAVGAARDAADSAARAAEDARRLRAGRVPREFAAEAVEGAHSLAAERIGAGWRRARGAAASGVGRAAAEAADAARVERGARADGVPGVAAAEGVCRAHALAADRVRAGGRRACDAALASGGAAALVGAGAAELDRGRRALLVPLDIAAEAVGGADDRAAEGVAARGGRLRLAAVARRGGAAADAADSTCKLRLARADIVPLALAAEGVDGADRFAAVGVGAASAIMGNAAIFARAATAGARADAAELNGRLRAELVPLHVAAEAVGGADERAARSVRARRRRLRRAAAACRGNAASDPAHPAVRLRERGADSVPAHSATERIGPADDLTAGLVRAPRGRVRDAATGGVRAALGVREERRPERCRQDRDEEECCAQVHHGRGCDGAGRHTADSSRT